MHYVGTCNFKKKFSILPNDIPLEKKKVKDIARRKGKTSQKNH